MAQLVQSPFVCTQDEGNNYHGVAFACIDFVMCICAMYHLSCCCLWEPGSVDLVYALGVGFLVPTLSCLTWVQVLALFLF
jgi:hypothetical protein